jgi:hypothetical protein
MIAEKDVLISTKREKLCYATGDIGTIIDKTRARWAPIKENG